MKVLHVININAFGGAEKLIPVFLPAFKEAGIQVKCLIAHSSSTPEAAQLISTQLLEAGIPVQLVGYTRITDKAITRQIASQVKQGTYNLVHSHLKYADIWMAMLKRRKEIHLPVVTTLHGYRDSYQNKFGLLYKKQIRLTPYYWITRFILRRLDGLIFISACLEKFYEDAGLSRKKITTVIHHGYAPTGALAEAGARTNAAITAPRIAMPGRLIHMKGHRYAIEVIRQLRSTHPGCTLHIYGTGPAEQEIREMVKVAGVAEAVLFYGYVNDVQERIKTMDIVLLPSQGEAFGMVFLEAFAAGVPVVAFDLPAGNEIIQDGVNGLLALPGNSESLLEKIKLLCADPELYNRIRNQAINDLKEKFSLPRVAADYKRFYETILAAQLAIKHN